MTFTFRPAVRERVSLLIGLAGASGAGKTFTALSIATGLAGRDGRIAVIDTEAGRALHYADQFRFDHGDMTAPFSPQRYAEAIAAADHAGYDVIVIDSFSHEYEGEGGIIEWAAAEEASGVKSPGNWKAPKTAHKKMVNRLLQTRAHLILCMRAEEKMKVERIPVTNPDGSPKMGRNGPVMRTEVIAASDLPLEDRWHAICEKRLPYELTASFLLLPSAPGVPVPLKLQEQHRHAFPQGQKAGVQCGAALRAWATGGAGATKPAQQAAAPAGNTETAPPAPQQSKTATIPLVTRAGQATHDRGGAWLEALQEELKAAVAEKKAGTIWTANRETFERLVERAAGVHQGAFDAVRQLAYELMDEERG